MIESILLLLLCSVSLLCQTSAGSAELSTEWDEKPPHEPLVLIRATPGDL